MTDRLQLAADNLGLGYSLARQYRGACVPAGLDRDDLEQEAALGLVLAVRAHDPSLGSFLTCAGRYVRTQIRNAIRSGIKRHSTRGGGHNGVYFADADEVPLDAPEALRLAGGLTPEEQVSADEERSILHRLLTASRLAPDQAIRVPAFLAEAARAFGLPPPPPAEPRAAAVARLTRLGLSAWEIAGRLDCSERSVCRFRSAARRAR
jgi:RNA polymerase sigma factor (sigma-70 family)